MLCVGKVGEKELRQKILSDIDSTVAQTPGSYDSCDVVAPIDWFYSGLNVKSHDVCARGSGGA